MLELGDRVEEMILLCVSDSKPVVGFCRTRILLKNRLEERDGFVGFPQLLEDQG